MLLVMWNWGGFAQRDLPRSPWSPGADATDATMGWLPTSGPEGAPGRQITPRRRSE
jgi:hypothetical protein